MNSGPATIVWFRQDLRMADNPALAAALGRGAPIIPLYVLDDDAAGDWRPGAASRWWLHGSLAALETRLHDKGGQLVLRRGRAAEVLDEMVGAGLADAVYWNRCYEPRTRDRDRAVKAALRRRSIDVQSFNSALLVEPWDIRTNDGDPYRVFTPFWKALVKRVHPELAAPEPDRIPQAARLPSDALSDWQLRPSSPDWAGNMGASWKPGESGARTALRRFLEQSLSWYRQHRDLPCVPGTSRLSPHLHWGEIGPRQIWTATLEHIRATQRTSLEGQAVNFLRELIWREFSYHLLFHFPHLPERSWRRQFANFPWRDDPAAFRAWSRGRTGYPLIDAGMRELWATGWMHNRLRMVTASFLVKHLMIPWQRGAAWFWDTLVDADLANNSASWQWVAGSGADAAPYFRIFNPVRQGETFDPEGAYVRRWVPELANLPDAYIHRPWDAPGHVLAEAGVELDKTYPRPIVDHGVSRSRALQAYQSIAKGAA